MWTLVFLSLINNDVEASIIGSYSTMYDCFDERERLSEAVGGNEGFFPPSYQAICVYREPSV